MAINDTLNTQVSNASKILREGGVIAYPTEGVYGLGCDPFNETAVRRLLKIKNRSAKKGLLLIAANWNQVLALIEYKKENLPKNIVNNPITWVIPKTKHTPSWISGKFSSVAIRITTHPVAKALCEKFGGPIVSTSANISDSPPAANIKQIKALFADKLDYIATGGLGGLKKPSEIRDIKTNAILRA